MVFCVGGSPRVKVKAKNKGCKEFEPKFAHFAVVPRLAVELGASWRGGSVVNGGGNAHNGEGMSAEDPFVGHVVIFVSDGGSNAARDTSFGGAGVG